MPIVRQQYQIELPIGVSIAEGETENFTIEGRFVKSKPEKVGEDFDSDIVFNGLRTAYYNEILAHPDLATISPNIPARVEKLSNAALHRYSCMDIEAKVNGHYEDYFTLPTNVFENYHLPSIVFDFMDLVDGDQLTVSVDLAVGETFAGFKTDDAGSITGIQILDGTKS